MARPKKSMAVIRGHRLTGKIYTFLDPLVTVNVGLNAGVIRRPELRKLTDGIDTAKERLTRFQVDIRILGIGRNVGDDKHLCITGLTVEVTTRKKKRIAVQIVEHIAMLQTAPELFKDDNILPVIGVKGVFVIGDTVESECVRFSLNP